MEKKAKNSFSQRAQALALRASEDKQAFSELICMYTKLIQASVIPMAETPEDVKDLTQEGLMGLFEAVRSYDPDKGALFVTYAGVCVKNKIVSSLRKKNRFSDEISVTAEDEDRDPNPEMIVIDKVRAGELKELMFGILSKKEGLIFERYLRGGSYEVIAKELGMPVKSVDNAMQRVRRKVKGLLSGAA